MSQIRLDPTKAVTSRLPIEPQKGEDGNYLNNGLNCVTLNSIHTTVEKYESGEFKGKDVTVLNFEFINYKFASDDPERYHLHKEKIIGTQKKEGNSYVPMEDKKVVNFIESMWGRIKHIFDACALMPSYRDIAEVPAEIIDEYFVLSSTGDVDERIAQFNNFFTFLSVFVNGSAEAGVLPIYRDNDGGALMWLKLLPNHPDGKTYQIPSWVRTGFVEPTRIDTQTGLPLEARILSIRPNESLELTPVAPKNANNANPALNAALPGAANKSLDYLRNKGTATAQPVTTTATPATPAATAK